MYVNKIPLSWKKSDIIDAFARAEEERRMEESFKELTVEEKLQNLSGKHYYENVWLISLCTDTELEEMAELLGVELETEWMEINPRYAFERGVTKALIERKYKPQEKQVGMTEILSGIESTVTVEGVEEILETKCTKAQIAEVYKAVTGKEYEYSLSRKPKSAMVKIVSLWIKRKRAEAEYQALTLSEKLDYLQSGRYEVENCSLWDILEACSLYERLCILNKLGVGFTEYKKLHIETPYVYVELILKHKLAQVL